MYSIFGNSISTLKRRDGKDIGTPQVSVYLLVFFISREKCTELHWKQIQKFINNLDQKLADHVPFFPCYYYFEDKVLWSIEENKHQMYCSNTDVKIG